MRNNGLFSRDVSKKIAVAGVLLLAGGTASAVQEDLTLCDYCSGAQYSQSALQAIDNGYVYVINRQNDTVKKFFVTTESEPGHSIEEATEVSPDAVDLQKINDGLAVYHDLNQWYQTTTNDLNLPQGTNPDSALDLVGNPFMRNDFDLAVANWARNNQLSIVSGLAADVLNAVVSGLSGAVTITFPDGSSYDFEFTNALTTNDGLKLYYEIIPGSGIGPNGHAIPEDATGFTGASITGTAGEIGNWADAAERTGRSVDLSQYDGSGSLRDFTMDCPEVDHCILHPEDD